MISFALAASLAAVVSAAPAPVPASARALTLDEAYAAALKRSEALAQAGETYAQIQAQIDQLWGQIQPRVSLVGSQFWQDTPGPNVSFPLPASQQTVAVNGHQPVFAGLRDFLAVRGARLSGEAAELSLKRARQVLYQDVATAYLNLLQSRRDTAVRDAQVKLNEGRIKDLNNFVDLGRSRRSEVLAAQSQLAQAAADLESSRGQERLYQATLQFVTGLEEDLAPQEVPVPAAGEELKPYLDRAAARPDVEAARRDFENAALNVTFQNRQYWPVIALDGNYYLRRPATFTKNVHWDATLSASVPLYWGGQISAQVRQAEHQRGFREQALSAAQRRARLEVRSAHADLLSGLAVVAALRSAVVLADENAKAQAKDYRNGLVTNIDVLSALTTVQNTRLRLDQAEAQAVLSKIRLETAAGGPGSAQ